MNASIGCSWRKMGLPDVLLRGVSADPVTAVLAAARLIII
jgi:hypothetical protein